MTATLSREDLITELLKERKGGVLRFTVDVPEDATSCVVYCRRSKDGGRSVRDQARSLIAWAEEEGWPIVALVVEHGSASDYATRAREYWPAVTEMIHAKEARLLLTWESSRADRRLRGYVDLREALIEAGALWGYGDHIYDMAKADDRERTASDALDSEKEANRISKRNQRTSNAMARDGSPTQGRAGWGFKRTVATEDGRRVVYQHPDPAVAPYIRTVAGMLLAGESGRTCREYLNDNGVCTATGHVWTDNTKLRRAITRPSLAGLRVHKGKVVGTAQWAPILHDERDEAVKIHNRLRALFAEQARETVIRKDPRAVHLLSGIMRCGKCGRGCTTRRKSGNYQCPHGCTTRNEEFVNAFVTQHTLQLLSQSGAHELFRPANNDRLDKAQAHLVALQERLKRYQHRAGIGEITDDEYMAIRATIIPEVERAEKTLASIYIVSPLLLDVAGDEAHRHWKALTTEQHRLIIGTLFDVYLDPLPKGLTGEQRYRDVRMVRRALG